MTIHATGDTLSLTICNENPVDISTGLWYNLQEMLKLQQIEEKG